MPTHTHRPTTLEELQASEAHLRAILEAEPECVKLLAADGALLEMNPAGLEMIEADSFGSVAGKSLYPLIVPEHRDAFRALTERVFGGQAGTLEFRIVGLRGGRRWLETHASPLRDPNGKVTAALGITRDVTERKRTETELRETLERFEIVLSATNDAVWDWDLKADTLWWSAGFHTLFGYPREVVLSDIRSWSDRVHPEDRERVLSSIHGVIDGGERVWSSEYRFLRNDGSYAHILDRGQVVRNSQGQAVRMLGAMQDITARKEAELQVRRLSRVQALLAEVNQTLVRGPSPAEVYESACRIAAESGGFLLAWVGVLRDGALEIVALAGADSEAAALLRSLVGERSPSAGCVYTQQAIERGMVAICNDIVADPRTTHWMGAAKAHGYGSMASLPLTVGGKVAAVFNLYAAEVGFFDSAELRLLAALAGDLSLALEMHRREEARSEAETALRASEERFRELAETIKEVFWVTTLTKDRMLYVSPAYEEIWGRTCESLYAAPQSWADALHPDDRERVLQAATTEQIEGRYDEEYRIVRPDGEVLWIRDQGFPVRDAEGRVMRIVGVAREITSRKQAEERLRQAQKMEAIGTLAGGVAHDFNNLLSVISGYSELLLDAASADAPSRTPLERIVQAAERGASLTHRLLSFSKKHLLQLRVLDLSSVVRETTDMLRRLIGEHIVLTFVPAGPCTVLADKDQVVQVLMNLVVNARDAMPRQGTLRIATECTRQVTSPPGTALPPGEYVVLEVSDTGSGMTEETLARLFEPFFTTKEATGGTGLGLSTVQGIVHGLHGDIEVVSHVGQGSTFRVYVPFTPAPPGSMPEPDPQPMNSRRGETILVVEDDAAVREIARELLVSAGYKVILASDSEQALRLVAETRGPIDLVLTDVILPGMTGRELADRLQSTGATSRVLFMSGFTQEAMGRDGLLGPGTHFIAKPFGYASLLQKVRDVLTDA